MIKLIKGGKNVDLSQEVNIQFSQLISRSAYFKKKKELKELKSLFIEYTIQSQEHLTLLEIFKQYNYLMDLGDVPFSFIGEYIDKIHQFLEKESKKVVNSK
jgi:hypothetical protein